MEKRIEKVTMITSDNEELSDDNEHNYSEFQYTQRVPFLEFGTDIIDGEYFSFYCEYYLLKYYFEIIINIYEYL
jgi:hypothetical protein